MKDHLKVLARGTDLCWNGKTDKLLLEVEIFYSGLHQVNKPKRVRELSKKFALLMGKGNANRVSKILMGNVSKGIFSIDDKTLSLLKQKNPVPSELNFAFILVGIHWLFLIN